MCSDLKGAQVHRNLGFTAIRLCAKPIMQLRRQQLPRSPAGLDIADDENISGARDIADDDHIPRINDFTRFTSW